MTFEEYIKEEREEAREEGREEGRSEGELEEEVDVLRPIYDCIAQNPDKDDKYILEQYQKI